MRRVVWGVGACVVAFAFLSAPRMSADELAPGARSWSSAVLGAEAWYAGALPPPGVH